MVHEIYNSLSKNKPMFSVITPVYNREKEIKEMIESVVMQTYSNWELIIVDDNSRDNSVETVVRMAPPQTLLLKRQCNGGPCPSRNDAVAQARGMWIVTLDSDFTFLPFAFETLQALCWEKGKDAGNVATSCVWDTGVVSPSPYRNYGHLDYERYLKWVEMIKVSEYLNCFRADVFQKIKYPDSRAWETRFHLDVARYFGLFISTSVVSKVGTRAINRLTTAGGKWAAERALLDAADKIRDLRLLLLDHGQAISSYAPKKLAILYRDLARLYFLVGNKREGLRYWSSAVRRGQFDVRMVGMLCAGMVGQRFTSLAGTVRWNRRR